MKKYKEARQLMILKLLKQGYHLSKVQIRAISDLINEGDTIFQLRKKLKNTEFKIKTRMETNKSTGSRFAVYYIEK